MAFEGKYDFEEVDYGTTGWNGILQSNMEKVESNLYSNDLGTLGETVAQYALVYLNSDGKYYRARATTGTAPAMGIALEAGILDDEVLILQLGQVTNVAWSWTPGQLLYLSSVTYGGFTTTSGTQSLGYAKSATEIFFQPDFAATSITATTTTTSTTTTTV